MLKDTKSLGNNKAPACESRGFVHKKGCARVLTQPHKNTENNETTQMELLFSIIVVLTFCFF